MKKWILKAVIQKVISWLPNGHRINYLFQQYVTRGVRLSEEYLEDKLVHFQRHRRFFDQAGCTVHGKKVLELGSGWYPIVPVCFFLSGAEQIITVDIIPFLDAEKVRRVLRELTRLHAKGRLRDYLETDPGRMELAITLGENNGLSLDELLKRLRIQYLVADARRLPLEDGTIDLITSNNTFEHIYPHVLEDILLEFKRVLRPNGMMSHFIDMSDHFAHLDSAITIYNFLRFSPGEWAIIDNTIQPQNRWRISQYRALYQKLGIPVSKEESRPGDLQALRAIAVHGIFQHIPEADLAVSHSYLVTGPS